MNLTCTQTVCARSHIKWTLQFYVLVNWNSIKSLSFDVSLFRSTSRPLFAFVYFWRFEEKQRSLNCTSIIITIRTKKIMKTIFSVIKSFQTLETAQMKQINVVKWRQKERENHWNWFPWNRISCKCGGKASNLFGKTVVHIYGDLSAMLYRRQKISNWLKLGIFGNESLFNDTPAR